MVAGKGDNMANKNRYGKNQARMGVVVSEKVYKALHKAAKANDRSISGMARFLICEELKKKGYMDENGMPIDKKTRDQESYYDALMEEYPGQNYHQAHCEHDHTTHQAEELDTHTPESLTCNDCVKELDIPEPDWSAMREGK